MPEMILILRTSLNTKQPIMSAVIGSNAPRMAVGVGPIYLIAIVRKIREIDKNRVISDLRFKLDELDTKLLIDSINNVMPFLKNTL